MNRTIPLLMALGLVAGLGAILVAQVAPNEDQFATAPLAAAERDSSNSPPVDSEPRETPPPARHEARDGGRPAVHTVGRPPTREVSKPVRPYPRDDAGLLRAFAQSDDPVELAALVRRLERRWTRRDVALVRRVEGEMAEWVQRGSPAKRRAALHYLLYIRQRDGIRPTTLLTLAPFVTGDPSPVIRSSCLWLVAGEAPSAERDVHLVGALADPDPLVRKTAAEGLGRLNTALMSREAEREVLQAIAREPDVTVRMRLVRSLAARGVRDRDRARLELERMLPTRHSTEERAVFATALATLDS